MNFGHGCTEVNEEMVCLFFLTCFMIANFMAFKTETLLISVVQKQIVVYEAALIWIYFDGWHRSEIKENCEFELPNEYHFV